MYSHKEILKNTKKSNYLNGEGEMNGMDRDGIEPRFPKVYLFILLCILNDENIFKK